jgi:hypothetical protein
MDPQKETLEGETFSHVFGINTALFEQFVLCRNVMGPCWLKIEGAKFTTVQNVTTYFLILRTVTNLEVRHHGASLKCKLTNRNK